MDALTMECRHATQVKEIEIGHLDLRYAHTRVHRPEIISCLVESIERCGQIMPVVTLKEGPCSFVLMDGYLRVAALRRCGKDTVLAQVWKCKQQEALIHVLAATHDRRWHAIEQAALIRELQSQFHLSQAKIACLLGRKQGWVSGRIALLDALPEDVLELIRKGHISTWAATRVIAPIARAIAEHASRLTENLAKEHMSTRDLAKWFSHYQKANRKTREKMVSQPGLFVKALRASEEDKQDKVLKDGPEGRWLKDLRVARQILRRLIKEVPTVMYKEQSRVDRRILVTAFEDTKRLLLALEQNMRRCNRDENCRDRTNHCEPASARGQNPRNQSDAQDLQEHGASSSPGKNQQATPETIALRTAHAHHL